MRGCRLKVEHKGNGDWTKTCSKLTCPVSPKKIRQNTVSADMCLLAVGAQDIHDSVKWRDLGRNTALKLVRTI